MVKKAKKIVEKHSRLRSAWIEPFLLALQHGGNVTYACKVAEIGKTAVYNLRATDQEFRQAWDEALAIGIRALEDEAIRRAYEGVDEPVFYRGEVVGAVKRYSDTLLIFLMKHRLPEVYNPPIRQDVASTIEVTTDGLSDQERVERIVTLLDVARNRRTRDTD